MSPSTRSAAAGPHHVEDGGIMSGQLYPRENCAHRLRERVSNDPWLARFALSWAMEQLELGELNDLVEAVDDVVVSESYRQRVRAEDLIRERFGS
jgi:hypothetical protein